ncbi:MAG: recombination protein RecR [Spirochaetes bacterium]|nr:MAG: recombination protein RecR [Spirochaetota bacterium]
MIKNKTISQLISEFSKLPGIGRKTAERLAYYIIKEKKEDARKLAEAIVKVKDKIGFCKICFNYAENDVCDICSDPSRDKKTICVVEEPRDIWAFENAGSYGGLYHVLLGVISPLDGVGPDDIKIRELLRRLESGEVEEVIIATSPTVEGDATAIYLSKIIKPLGIKVTRIASGLPAGGEIEYADSITLIKAIQGRRPI